VALFGRSDGSFRTQPFVLDFARRRRAAIGDFNAAGDGANDVVAGYAGFRAVA
jgi:hypothetical protein